MDIFLKCSFDEWKQLYRFVFHICGFIFVRHVLIIRGCRPQLLCLVKNINLHVCMFTSIFELKSLTNYEYQVHPFSCWVKCISWQIFVNKVLHILNKPWAIFCLSGSPVEVVRIYRRNLVCTTSLCKFRNKMPNTRLALISFDYWPLLLQRAKLHWHHAVLQLPSLRWGRFWGIFIL